MEREKMIDLLNTAMLAIAYFGVTIVVVVAITSLLGLW